MGEPDDKDVPGWSVRHQAATGLPVVPPTRCFTVNVYDV